MAVVLELALEQQVSPASVITWLAKKGNEECEPTLRELDRIKPEFVPFFLNYLRDQSSSLLQGCRSTNQSPAKTPASLKVNKKTKAPLKPSHTPSNVIHSSSTSRTLKFTNSSPQEPTLPPPPKRGGGGTPSALDLSETGFGFKTPETSRDKSVSFNWSTGGGVRSSGGSGNRRHRNSPTVDMGNSSGVRQSWPNMFQTPDSGPRSKHRTSLADYFMTPDHDHRKRRSPNTSQGSQNRKSSGKKGQNVERRINPTQIKSSNEWPGSPPVFSLGNNEDFPTLGTSPSTSTPTQQDDSTLNIPSGAKIITASRHITPTALSNSSSEPTRRITPTLVTNSTPTGASAFKTVYTSNQDVLPSTNSAFSVIEKPSPASSPGDEPKSSLDPKTGPLMVLNEERQLLREAKSHIPDEATTPKAKAKIVAVVDITPSKLDTITPTKALRMTLERLPNIADNVKPLRSEVTNEECLNILVEIYAGCLHENLVPNLMIELYFIIQLLTVRGGDFESLADVSPDLDEINYLGNVHNAVYFAVKVFATQKRLLTLLDKGTMKLLIENCRIREFESGLVEQFLDILDQCQSRRLSMFPPSPVGGVSFQADTDNRKNFPNDRSFQLFKKQRDQFYELLRDWEENHLTSGWSLNEALGDRIRNLVSSKIDMANHIHFTRLFQSQLIQMCKGDNSFKQEGDDDSISLLSQLKQSNPQKFKMLQERFITPSSAGSPCPPPSFPGCQEFFRDFILAAACHIFNQYLVTTMAAKISELNGIQIIAPESDVDVDPIELQPERQQLTQILLTLRLLGKFLGFVTFLPYQSLEKLPDSMQATCIAMREKLIPCVDLAEYLRTARENGSVVLTLPWVVEFLSQMDSLASHLDTYKLAFLLLLQIYRQTSRKFARKEKASFSCALILLTLGWLFEQQVFPEGLFFSEYEPPEDEMDVVSSCLDHVDLVDHNLLYTCCPYLGEAKSLLLGFALGASHRGSSIRKITPLTTEAPSVVAISEKQLQIQLEDNFFHNHPASLKRTVDFVGDRIASNYIKKFRAQTLPVLLHRGSSRVRDIVNSITEDPVDNRTKKKVLVELEEAAMQYSNCTRNQTNLEAHGYTAERSQVILPLLLPGEGCCEVVSIAAQICCRIARDKINTWMATHINKAMLQKEMTTEFEKLIKQPVHMKCRTKAAPPAATNDVKAEHITAADTEYPETMTSTEPTTHHDKCPYSPSDLIIQLKEFMYEMYVGCDECTSERICTILDNIHLVLSHRRDVVPAVFKTLGKMTVDLASLMASNKSSLLKPGVKDKLLLLWKQELRPHIGFDHVICSKHVYEIQSSDDSQKCWRNFKDYITMVMDAGLLSKFDIATGCLNLLKMNLPKDIVAHLSEVLCSAIENERRNLEKDNIHCSTQTPSDPSDKSNRESDDLENMLHTLDWLLQLCDEESAICERLRNCIVVTRGTQIMLNQNIQDEAEERKGSQVKTVTVMTENTPEMNHDDNNKETDVKQSKENDLKENISTATTSTYVTDTLLSKDTSKNENNNGDHFTYRDQILSES